MRKSLILVGGGHAHMMILENIAWFIKRNVKVTVIGPSYFHYYSGMGPGMLGGTYKPDDIRFATKKVVLSQDGIFVKDKVVRIDPDLKKVFTKSGQSFDYDILSINAGSYVPLENVISREDGEACDNIYPVKPIEQLMDAADRLKGLFREKKIHVAVVGGGPSSAEIAGNVWQLAKRTKSFMPEITIFGGHKFMARFPESVRKRVKKALVKKEITINENGYASAIEASQVKLESGKIIPVDFIFLALGVKPSTIFEESGLPTGPDKGLLVNSYLQSVKYPEIFGGGDCIHFENQPLDKVGVYAVRQNPVLLNNLKAKIEDRELQVFEPGPDYLLIFNTGGGTGVLKKQKLVFGGRVAFWIKDYIDRRFMKKFQAFEKRL